MRAAKAQDYWRAVYRASYPCRLEQVAFSQISGIADGHIKMAGAITALCGANGVGKSTLLSAVGASLAADLTEYQKGRLQSAMLQATVVGPAFSGVVSTSVASAERSGDPELADDALAESLLVDPGLDSQRLIEFFRNTTNLSELLEGYEPTVLEPDDIKILAYIVGKDYEACEILELDAFEPPDVVPYFRVRADGVDYGSEFMGLGEMALHLTFWRLKNAPEGSVLIIEEPEAHISPRSQAALLDVMAWMSVERKLWVIITTHSPGIVTRVPAAHIRLVFRAAGQVRIIEAPTDEQLSGILGVVPRRNVIVLVEDDAAKTFVEALVANSPDGLDSRIDVRTCRDAGTLRAVLQRFPLGRSDDRAKIVGLLDGDQRHVALTGSLWPFGYLPGDGGVERLLRGQTLDVKRVATRLGVEQERLELALSEVAGRDDHDWLSELGKRAGVPLDTVTKALVQEWMSTEQGLAGAAEVIALLKSAALPESGSPHAW